MNMDVCVGWQVCVYLLMAASLLVLSFWSSRSLASRALLSSVHPCTTPPLRCREQQHNRLYVRCLYIATTGSDGCESLCCASPYLARIAGAAVAGRVQAERGPPPRASSGRLRSHPRPALPDPPPPRALHAGEHPGHEDHPRSTPPVVVLSRPLLCHRAAARQQSSDRRRTRLGCAYVSDEPAGPTGAPNYRGRVSVPRIQ